MRVYGDTKTGRITRVWIGYYHVACVDHRSGITISTLVRSAGVNEADLHEEAYARARYVTGVDPWAAVYDAGYYARKVVEHNNERDVASIVPGRGRSEHLDTHSFDRHLVGHCEHCGAPGAFLRWRKKSKAGGAGVMFKCALPVTDRCRTHEQFHAQSKDPLRIRPLWMNSPIYQQLSASRGNYEHAHDDRDTRYGAGGANTTSRTKRLGIPRQQLDVTAASMLDMLSLVWRLELLPAATMRSIRARFAGQVRRFGARFVPQPATYEKTAEEWVERMRETRREHGLDGHWGSGAVTEGLGPLDPPSVAERKKRTAASKANASKKGKHSRRGKRGSPDGAEPADRPPDPGG